MTCYETLMFGNTEFVHFEMFFGLFNRKLRGNKHTLTFNMPFVEEQKDVGFGGVKVFAFCDGIVDNFQSVFRSLEAFLGGVTANPDLPGPLSSHVPEYMEKANIEFLSKVMEYTMEPRDATPVELDESLIQAGDYFAVMRLDGLDQIVMYGTGSHSGHSVIAMRFEEDPQELYILESQDAWYWPTHGIQRTKFKDWIHNAKNADFHVVWMPLSDEARKNFNVTAAQEWFVNTAEGLPYGYHNFLYGWIDTPTDNWPAVLANEFVPILFSILEKVIPSTVDIFYSQAINKRLGTEGLNIAQLAAAAADKKMSIQDVMAMPEQDGWKYTGLKPRDGEAMVCSAFVAALWKAGGMFGPHEVNATEWATKDVYLPKFFNPTMEMPAACQAANPGDTGYCQILGKYKMTFPEFSTYETYDHMFDKCGSLWPDYTRAPGC